MTKEAPRRISSKRGRSAYTRPVSQSADVSPQQLRVWAELDEGDLLGMYIIEAGVPLLLKKDQEVALFQSLEPARLLVQQLSTRLEEVKVAEGDTSRAYLEQNDDLKNAQAVCVDIRNQIMSHNLRLVISIAKQYRSQKLDLNDLISEGNLGLVDAIDRFDWRRNIKFSTFATYWIKQKIGRFLLEQSRTIKLPVHLDTDMRKVYRTINELQARTGQIPTPLEIAQVTGLTVQRIENLLRWDRLEAFSLDENRFHGNSKSEPADWSETVAADDESATDLVEARQLSAVAEQILVQMEHPPLSHSDDWRRFAEILRLHFGLHPDYPESEGMTLEEIGAKLFLTRERIRQLRNKALILFRKLGAPYGIEDFKEDVVSDKGKKS